MLELWQPGAQLGWLLGGVAAVPLVVYAAGLHPQAEPAPRQVIGPTAQVTEASSGVAITARVDTGAAVTSLHVGQDDLVIPEPAEDPVDNLGKSVRLRVANRDGESSWVETRLVDYVEVRSANGAEHRYRVRLPLRYGGVEKSAIVNLNDRSQMTYRMLLGRDFLEGDFIVDVSQPDTPSS